MGEIRIRAIHNRTKEDVHVPTTDGPTIDVSPGQTVEGPWVIHYDEKEHPEMETVASPNEVEVARQVLAAEKAEANGRLDEMESILPDPDIGALTQIFREYKPDAAPEIIKRVVVDIDTNVRQIRFTGWQTTHPGDQQVRQEVRLVLRKYDLPATGELFDRAYAYIVENY